MKMRSEDWAGLLDDEEHGGLLVPILALAQEHDPDPEMRPYKEPMTAERREQLMIGIAARRRLTSHAKQEGGPHWRSGPKVGLNDPCPCGSGKKFKKCCGALTLH